MRRAAPTTVRPQLQRLIDLMPAAAVFIRNNRLDVLAANALGRARTGRHQAGLSLDERLVNVAGAFRVLEPDNVDGKRVLLVDDVITTGATAAACAQALLDAGAQSVFAVALATVEFDALPSRSQPIAETAEEDEKEIEKT